MRDFPGEKPGPWVFLDLSPSLIPTGNDSFEMFELFVEDIDFHELYFVFLCHDCVVSECVCEYWEELQEFQVQTPPTGWLELKIDSRIYLAAEHFPF